MVVVPSRPGVLSTDAIVEQDVEVAIRLKARECRLAEGKESIQQTTKCADGDVCSAIVCVVR
jgi:tetrahydromethanopterin S-methyltransferase subunit F